MNFIAFSTATTNLFPASNTVTGGQLVSEWNLRSREMVATDPAVTYQVGPSFVHGEKDFEVSLKKDGGVIVSSTELSIAEGRAVVNGHYLESLVPISIDMVKANSELAAESMQLLKGRLAIGLKTFYATDATIAGSIEVEDAEGEMFLGVKVVILPEEEMITPSDSPLDQSKVTADIVLAKFTYLNNVVTNIVNLPEKLQYLTSDRVKDLDTIVSNKYVTKTGLNSKKIYAFAGKSKDPQTGLDTWEDVTDSMIVWDHRPDTTTTKPALKEAAFMIDDNTDSVYLALPHKQVYGMTTYIDGKEVYEYYLPKILDLPAADYSTATPGTVTKAYTKKVQEIASKINDMRHTLMGKQVMFMETRTITTALPDINKAWEIGDYVLVKNDDYLMGEISSTESSPATMYVILPGKVYTIQFITELQGNAEVEPEVPLNIEGVELVSQEWYESAGQSLPDTDHPEYYPQFFDTSYPPRGVPNEGDTWYDYFRIRYYYKESSEEHPGDYPFTDFYYGVATTGPREWSDAVLVTGSVALATENTIGGFYNASDTVTDAGYVRLDDSGHLQLIDYELLRSGTLAYQLFENVNIPEGTTIDEIQTILYQYVNRRVAFYNTVNYSGTCDVVDIYIPIADSEEGGVLEICGVDSRFNTAVCIHITGDAGSNVTINIRDCQKIMIDPSIQGTPIINVYRSCLRYDPVVIDYIRTCPRDESVYGDFKGLMDISLWYERFSDTDPYLTVNDMTVSQIDSQIMIADINYWKELDDPVTNDNDYFVALKSITFSGYGQIINCEVLVANNSTDNLVIGDKIIIGDATLPQGSSLVYPVSSLTKQLKVDGEFTTAYYSDEQWYVMDTSFSLLTGVYDEASTSKVISGQVAFHSKTVLIPSTIIQTSIQAWEPNTYHVFRGGSIT